MDGLETYDPVLPAAGTTSRTQIARWTEELNLLYRVSPRVLGKTPVWHQLASVPASSYFISFNEIRPL